jgi:hypothetical protein
VAVAEERVDETVSLYSCVLPLAVVNSISLINVVGKSLRRMRVRERWFVVEAVGVDDDEVEVEEESIGESVTVQASPRRKRGGPLAMAVMLAGEELDDVEEDDGDGNWAS